MTKAARLQKAREILDKYQSRLGENLEQNDLDQFMSVLPGFNFYAVKCLPNPHYPAQKRYINVQYEPFGEWSAFSWNGAINGTREDSSNAILVGALRRSVRGQLSEFANNNELICAICASGSDPTVDHVNTAFKTIFDDFINENGIPALINQNDGYGWRFKDEDVQNQWGNYHKERSTLRILCRSCNAKMGTKSHD